MNIKFKQRITTDTIQVTCRDEGGISYEELYKRHRQKGDFHVDVHYFIDRMGFTHEGRQETAVAGIDLEEIANTLHILVDIEGKLNDCQRVALHELLEVLQMRYPNAKLRKEEFN